MTLYSSFARNIILPFSDFALGTSVSKKIDFLAKSQYWNIDKLEKYQNNKLREILLHSYKTVPYYHKIFRERKLYPDDIKNQNDLKKLPIITKTDIKNNYKDFLSRDINSLNPVVSRTGGTTGKPFRYFSTKNSTSMMWATTFRGWSWGGYKFGEKRATLAGTSLIPNESPNFKQRLRLLLERNLALPSVHVTDNILEEHSKKLINYKTKYLRGFPSVLYEFSEYVRNNDINGINPKAIFSTAEALYPHQRKSLEETFGCKVFNNYSNPESGGNARECQYHSGFHLGYEWAISEFVNDVGESISSGESGEMLFTNLHNHAMPFIRYRSEDTAVFTDEICNCGRKLPIIKSLEGRISDNLIFSNGVTIPGPMIVHIFRLFHEVENYQLIQSNKDSVDVKLVKGPNFTEEHASKISEILIHHCGKEVDVRIKYVKQIQRTKGGKKRSIIVNC